MAQLSLRNLSLLWLAYPLMALGQSNFLAPTQIASQFNLASSTSLALPTQTMDSNTTATWLKKTSGWQIASNGMESPSLLCAGNARRPCPKFSCAIRSTEPANGRIFGQCATRIVPASFCWDLQFNAKSRFPGLYMRSCSPLPLKTGHITNSQLVNFTTDPFDSTNTSPVLSVTYPEGMFHNFSSSIHRADDRV
ncbi:hypothetical protein DL93DRAFT_1175695 [Clavulina sp. PMI_390]|nr:hypothetical protein DL93DRAFT_1175695 [Clavulina sp. PMI_390]